MCIDYWLAGSLTLLFLELKFGGDGGGDAGQLVGSHRQLGLGEVHVALALHRDDVDMGMGHFEADDGHAALDAWHCLLGGVGYAACETQQRLIFLFAEVKDVVDLMFGHTKHVARSHRIDVEKSKIAVVFGDFITRDVAGYNA